MSTPLTDSINALTAYANEVTGASDTTLSDAVGRLCEGYGWGDGRDVVVTETVGNTYQLAIQILNNFESPARYAVCLKTANNPTLENIIYGVCVYKNSNSVLVGAGIRYRNGIYKYVTVAVNYDAATTIGDIYTVYRIA